MKNIYYMCAMIGMFAQLEAMNISERRIERIELPDGVWRMADRVLVCPNVQNLTFKWCFSQLSTNIRKVFIPDMVDCVGDACFARLQCLEEVEIEKFCNVFSNLTKIDKHAFAESSIREISIPFTVKELGDRCFMNCSALNSVVFEDRDCITPPIAIGVQAFFMTSIMQIEIPARVSELADGCFCNCVRLQRVDFSKTWVFKEGQIVFVTRLSHIGIGAFANTAIEQMEIPNSVLKIGYGCFMSCRALHRLVFAERSKLRECGDLRLSTTPIRTIETFGQGIINMIGALPSSCRVL